MKKINQNAVPWEEDCSPKGKFHLFRRPLSLALGAKKDLGTWGGGHPFDLEMVRLPAGAVNFPLHSHSVMFELYVILAGCGTLRSAEGETPLVPGDCVMAAPGDAHQIFNPGPEELVYYIIADNPPTDVNEYPATGKWRIKRMVNGKFERKLFRMTGADYFEGEE